MGEDLEGQGTRDGKRVSKIVCILFLTLLAMSFISYLVYLRLLVQG